MRKLIELQYKKRLINYKLKELIKKEDKIKTEEFYIKHKTIIRIFDIAVLIAILFNIGALLITNAMVVKEEPEIEFYETNVVVAEKYDYVPHKCAEEEFDKFTDLIDFYWKILVLYFIIRMTTLKLLKNELGIYALGIFVSYFFVMFGYDFIHDFGFWIGKIL